MPLNDEYIPSPGHTPPSWSISGSTPSPLSTEEQFRRDQEREKRFCEKLVKDGARPWYDVHRIDEISKNPRKHDEILRYWQGSYAKEDPDHWFVFGGQWQRWKQFREWQGQTRQQGRISQCTDRCKELVKNTSTSSFELNQDPERQDKLATWIEYLSYECTIYDQHARYKHSEPRYIKALKKLQDSRILRPHETVEFISSIEYRWQEENEGKQAAQAMESAEKALLSAQKATAKPWSAARQQLAVAQSELVSAKRRLDSFERRSELIEQFIVDTAKYRKAKREAERQTMLLQWVREQIPLIEVELNQSDRVDAARDKIGRDRLTEKSTTSQRESRKRRRDVSPDDRAPMKRSRHVYTRSRPSPGEDARDTLTTIVLVSGLDTDEEHSGKQKKQELMHPESIPLSGSTAVLPQVGEEQTHPHSAIDRDHVQGSTKTTSTGCPSRSVDSGLRRSARIAARQNTSRTAITFPTLRSGLRPKLHKRPAEPRGSSLSRGKGVSKSNRRLR